MKLYYNPLSTYSNKVMIAFNEKGVSYEPILVNLMTEEGRAECQRVNPTGKIPLLKQGEDWQLPESTSIIEYLEEKFPDGPSLIPHNDREAARQVRFIDRMADLYFNNPVLDLVFQQMGFLVDEAFVADEEKIALARKYIAMTYADWDKRLASQPWMCGDHFSMADCAAIPPMFYAQTLAPFADHPNIEAYWQRAQKRPSYAKIKAEMDPVWNELQGLCPA